MDISGYSIALCIDVWKSENTLEKKNDFAFGEAFWIPKLACDFWLGIASHPKVWRIGKVAEIESASRELLNRNKF